MKSSPIQALDKEEGKRLPVSIVIPAYRPDPEGFTELIRRLAEQTVPPAAVRVVNTLENTPAGWEQGQVLTTEEMLCRLQENEQGACGPERVFDRYPSLRLMQELENRFPVFAADHIQPSDYDHAFTRDMEARRCETPLVIFMTQDALPADRKLLEHLSNAFSEDDTLACAYARQLPAGDADIMERFTRSFNYPPESRTKRREDLAELGIKAFFCSNVCAGYRMDIYLARGGFEGPAVFNEDMVYAGKTLLDGYGIRYCAQARVIHSHNYSGRVQFHRNFDLGVSQAQHPELFQREDVSSESEGVRMLRKMVRFLLRNRRADCIPKMIWISGCKYAGYFLGRRYRKLPSFLVLRCTSDPRWFRTLKR